MFHRYIAASAQFMHEEVEANDEEDKVITII